MANLEQLTSRALRAYEIGRLKAASRVAWTLVPVALLCLLEANSRETCGCLGVLLLGVSIWLRWRDRTGFEAVTTGLLAGGIPLLAGLALARFDIDCGTIATARTCNILSAVVGVAAGSVIAVREAKRGTRFPSVVAAAAISVLAASLGCLRLGSASVLSVAFGIAVGAAFGGGRKRPA
jgi:hypothetical protein